MEGISLVSWHHLVRRSVSTVVMLGISSLLVLALGLGATAAFGQTPRACACGMGSTPKRACLMFEGQGAGLPKVLPELF